MLPRGLIRSFVLCLCFGLGLSLNAQTLRVAAASDLRWALEDLRAIYEKDHLGTKIAVTYGSSGNFHAQLLNQAPFDLFLSADVSYPENLVQRGFGLKDSLFIYGIGRVVLWVPNASPVKVEKLGLTALKQPIVKKIALANPKHAPYGRAAEAAIRKAGMWEELQDKLVLGENISQTAQFTQSGAADIGFIAFSLVIAGPMKDRGRWWMIPQEDHPLIEQGGVILTWAQDPVLARGFRDFMMSPSGLGIMQRYGFSRKAP